MNNIMIAECENCKAPIQIKSELKYQKEFNVNNNIIYLSFYDCPKCKKRHFVQIDNNNTLKMLVESKKYFKLLAKAKLNYDTLSKKKIKRFNSIRNQLNNSRYELMKEYQEKELIDGEQTFLIKFSI